MYDRELLKIAHLYYDLGLTQQQIAERVHTSRPRVSRLLKKALEQGVVRISVEGYDESNLALEGRLEEHLGLEEAIIADVGDDVHMANLTLRYLETVLSDGNLVGVSYGSTISRVCGLLPKTRSGYSVDVIQLAGGFNTPTLDFKPDEVANILCSKLGQGAAYSVYAPLIVEDSRLRDLFYGEGQYVQIQKKYSEVDLAMVAVGCLNETGMVIRDGFVLPEQLKRLREGKAVGDVALHFFDKDGNIADAALDEATMGISVFAYKNIPIRIGVARGAEKLVPIWGAVRGGWINALVTDTQTALELLET